MYDGTKGAWAREPLMGGVGVMREVRSRAFGNRARTRSFWPGASVVGYMGQPKVFATDLTLTFTVFGGIIMMPIEVR